MFQRHLCEDVSENWPHEKGLEETLTRKRIYLLALMWSQNPQSNHKVSLALRKYMIPPTPLETNSGVQWFLLLFP